MYRVSPIFLGLFQVIMAHPAEINIPGSSKRKVKFDDYLLQDPGASNEKNQWNSGGRLLVFNQP